MPLQKKTKDHTLSNYAIYSNMGIEMGVIIAIGVFGGVKLDQKWDCAPTFTIILSLSAVGIAIYTMIRTVLRTQKKSKDEPNDTH
ncbi:MAG: AtpZ/AtpI family protein [Bacteroidales bacterium]|jgi:F0F1-type ATP synthase assembly protein I|nr:AtpZ/AtpI family protein [Bacteroidales bacterium]